MSSFTVRIELHGASREDYERLHEKMRTGGFRTTIKGDNGVTYQMPPAEYRLENSALSAVQVQQKASAIAGTVRPNAVFVTQGDICAWSGLEYAYAAA